MLLVVRDEYEPVVGVGDVRFCRDRFSPTGFNSNVVWDLIKPVSTFALIFNITITTTNP